jgi:hypothetical protein
MGTSAVEVVAAAIVLAAYVLVGPVHTGINKVGVGMKKTAHATCHVVTLGHKCK